jgi:hypothetical protein
MSDVVLAVEKLSPLGLEATYNGTLSASNTYFVRNSGRAFLHFKKSAAVDCVVTIQTPVTVGGLAVAEQTVTVDATTGDVFIGPFPPSIYNDGNNDLKFTLSDVDGLTVAVLEL